MIKECLKKIFAGEFLTTKEAEQAMDSIMKGEATSAQIAGFLIALKQRSEQVDEVAGFVRSMRNHLIGLHIEDDNAVVGCGTGGDGSKTFNISTAAAIVASAAGVTVAKHGNRSVSSQCGSADFFLRIALTLRASFRYNLVQYLRELGATLSVYRNDALSVKAILKKKPAGIVSFSRSRAS